MFHAFSEFQISFKAQALAFTCWNYRSCLGTDQTHL